MRTPYGLMAAALLAASLPTLAPAAERPPYWASQAYPTAAPGRGLDATVADRPREQTDPRGVRWGSYLVLPQVTTGIAYDDNIFRVEKNGVGDGIATIAPKVEIKSDFSRHRMDFSAGANAGFYFDHDSENYVDYDLGMSGRYDIFRGLQLETSLQYWHGHEDRGSVDFGAGVEPTQFDSLAGEVAAKARVGRMRLRIGGAFVSLDYGDVDAVGGGSINHDDRDRLTTDAFGRAGVAVSPNLELFLAGRYGTESYDAPVDDDGINRDATAYSVALGADADLGGVWFASGFVGYRGQGFDDPALDDVNGFDFGAKVTGNVTELTTVSFDIDREIVDTATTGASSYWNTAGRVRVDHELLRELIVSAELRARVLDFQGIDRADNHWGGGFALRWLLSRNVWARLDYDYDTRTSSGVAAVGDFARNRVLLRALFQL